MNKPKSKSKDELILKIKVEPRSSRSGIMGQYGDAIKVKLNSPPVDGKANTELIEVLAKEYGISKKDVEIISGFNSKNKLVRLKGI
ncbi:MAG: YggU family protein [Nitrospirae bacterium]|nr:YggU family protein [Nitrospirota bacterium]